MSTHNHSRRIVLRSFLASGCALCLPRLSVAQGGKISKVQAQYQDQANGDQMCSNCINFVGPNSCRIVEGSISPGAWCKLWAGRSE